MKLMSEVKAKIKRIRQTLKDRVEPDRIPIHDFFWEEFLDRWRKEMGLPEDTNIYEYYDMDMMVITPIWDPIKKQIRIIENNDDYITYEDGFGALIKKVKSATMPQYLDFKYKKLDDLEKFNFDSPNDSERYEKPMSIISHGEVIQLPSFVESVKNFKDKLCVFGSVCEGHESIWRIHGPEQTYTDLALYPDRIKNEVEIIGNFMLEIGKKQLETPGINGMVIWGDVAYKNGMLFSPKTWKEIFYPVVKKMCTEFKKYDIPIIYHGCGNSKAVLDDLVELGIDAYHTLEVKAGMDVIELKKNYKSRLAYLGNIDALNVLPGSKENLKKDLLYKLNAAKGGGYMPGSDHSVPGNVSAENYDYFIDLIGEYGKYPLNLGEYDIDI